MSDHKTYKHYSHYVDTSAHSITCIISNNPGHLACALLADAALLHHRKVAALLHGRELKERRAMEKAIVDYRRQYQQPLRQRGFDPEDAQMMLPGLVGEEPDGGSRRSRQKEQLREWLLQQQRERTAERHQQKLDGRFAWSHPGH